MTTRQKMVVVSVIALLAIGSSVHESRRAGRLEHQLASTQAQQAAEPVLVRPVEQPAPAPVGFPEPAKKLGWQQIESPDYYQFMANLRAMGCPEQTIQDIVVAEVNRDYAARAKALREASTNRYAYWNPKTHGYASLMDEEMMEKMMALTNEKRAVLKALLGMAVPEPLDALPPYMNLWEMRLDYLPPETRAEAMSIEQQANARLFQIGRAFEKGQATAERDRIYAEKEEALSSLFSPEEKFEYDLRMSPSAENMLFYLRDFEPTEQEFREIVRLRLAMDRELGLATPNPSPDETARRKAAQKQFDIQIRALLGEERYKQLKAARR